MRPVRRFDPKLPFALMLPLPLLLAACSAPPGPGAAAGSAAPTLAAATPDPSRPLPLPLPEVVARVNGQQIRIRQILPLAKAALDKASVAERERRKPEAIRQALDGYVSRELLLQEALARGIAADAKTVEWSYDQLRRDHPQEAEWAAFLAGQGMDPQELKAELRIQATVAALLEREVQEWAVPEAEARALFEANPRGFGPPGAADPPSFESVRGEVERAVREYKAEEIRAALVARLRARARIELFL
jgi:hypothetical protein